MHGMPGKVEKEHRLIEKEKFFMKKGKNLLKKGKNGPEKEINAYLCHALG